MSLFREFKINWWENLIKLSVRTQQLLNSSPPAKNSNIIFNKLPSKWILLLLQNLTPKPQFNSQMTLIQTTNSNSSYNSKNLRRCRSNSTVPGQTSRHPPPPPIPSVAKIPLICKKKREREKKETLFCRFHHQKTEDKALITRRQNTITHTRRQKQTASPAQKHHPIRQHRKIKSKRRK